MANRQLVVPNGINYCASESYLDCIKHQNQETIFLFSIIICYIYI